MSIDIVYVWGVGLGGDSGGLCETDQIHMLMYAHMYIHKLDMYYTFIQGYECLLSSIKVLSILGCPDFAPAPTTFTSHQWAESATPPAQLHRGATQSTALLGRGQEVTWIPTTLTENRFQLGTELSKYRDQKFNSIQL